MDVEVEEGVGRGRKGSHTGRGGAASTRASGQRETTAGPEGTSTHVI